MARYRRAVPRVLYALLINMIDLQVGRLWRPQSQRTAAEKKRGILTYTSAALPQPPKTSTRLYLVEMKSILG